MTLEIDPGNHAEVNVARRLTEHARQAPDQIAIVQPCARSQGAYPGYRTMTFGELDQESDRLAQGLIQIGVTPGTRLALMVRPGIDFVALVFALLKSGAVAILIDPGMGRRNLLQCLASAEPEGFIAIPAAHAVRVAMRRRFPKSRFHVTVGRRWFWGGVTLDQLRALGNASPPKIVTRADDPAAIIFTTGSTGIPKGVLYQHRTFDQQVAQIQQRYAMPAGSIDLACFPLFGLFNSGMGITTVFPEMDATRPADADPKKILKAINDWRVEQSFASPALWNCLSLYCEQHSIGLPTLRRVFSAGAPVSGRVLARMKSILSDEAEMWTPYGATESLPVASISATEVLNETQQQTDEGAGVCVGTRFSGIRWQVIRIEDGPIAMLDDAVPLESGEIGELIVTGPVVTREYVTRPEANRLGKIADGPTTWHRMGDVGYLDAQHRFWFCGRMAHRVRSGDQTWYTIPCEAVFNTHPEVFRSALVGVGPPGYQQPVMVIEPLADRVPETPVTMKALFDELFTLGQRHDHTRAIEHFLYHASLPVDIRHNAKICREKLAPWAESKLGRLGSSKERLGF